MICEWNYRVLTITEYNLEVTLKEYGKKYWEAISITRKEDGTYLTVMKRRVYNTRGKKMDIIAP